MKTLLTEIFALACCALTLTMPNVRARLLRSTRAHNSSLNQRKRSSSTVLLQVCLDGVLKTRINSLNLKRRSELEPTWLWKLSKPQVRHLAAMNTKVRGTSVADPSPEERWNRKTTMSFWTTSQFLFPMTTHTEIQENTQKHPNSFMLLRFVRFGAMLPACPQ